MCRAPTGCSQVTRDEILALFERTGAVRAGHFLLSSGLHSAGYVQCALVLQHPELAERLARELAARLGEVRADAVVSPALGGVIVGHELGRALGCRAIFTERDPACGAGGMTLRRGFTLAAGERVVLAEDVCTTGGSTREVLRVVEAAGARAVAAAALIDRGGFTGQMGAALPAVALLEMRFDTWPAAECPLCRSGSSPEKPGSRK
jgi:orotate phosphoribosyltransferase